MVNSSQQQPWTRSTEDTIKAFGTSAKNGLNTQKVKNRRRTAGPNRIEQKKRKSTWVILLDQFKNLIVLLLGIAAGLSFFFGQWLEGLSITAALFINAAIGFVTELKAVRSMEALKQMSRVHTRVLRSGSVREIPAEDLVPGDLVVLESGDIVSADLRILEASRLQADESVLTGESVPISKNSEVIKGEVPLAERNNMLFKGTFITQGSGKGVVTAIAMDTQLGKVAALTEEAEAEHTPLEKRLNRLAYRLVWITLVIAGFVVISGLIGKKEPLLILETAIALAVAAIPEGLPIVATVALAKGMWRMAKRNAVMKRLSAVETLGATSVICTDKTGTLTENRITVNRIALAVNENMRISVDRDANDESAFRRENGQSVKTDAVREILEIGVLCNNAELHDGDDMQNGVGDPLEVALLVAGAKIGIMRKDILETRPKVREESFDSKTKMMATFHETRNGCRVAVKGAPEAVIKACTRIRAKNVNNP
jgi:Ca2+-transporting ATPase